ncbi:MAG TPA: type II toxin-antitoxin system RelE/ParE family toxin [bacterium]|jgi:plasmid stabilization system protein ParE|nr:type II toxin-antitoxin system RelE/ParE family toxin [bacterium]
MSQIIVSSGAQADLVRLRQFIQDKNPDAAERAAQTLIDAINLLSDNPELGKPHPKVLALRLLFVPFGRAGYVVAYRYLNANDQVTILAIRHQREQDDC